MCGPSTSRTIYLAQIFSVFNPENLPVKAVSKYRHFFAQSHRGSGLAMSVRQHRHLRGLGGERAELIDQLLCPREPHLFHGTLNPNAVCQIVNIFGSAENMNGRQVAG